MRVYESNDLVGRTVIDAAGRALGEISELLFDADDWKVVALRVKLRKDAADALGIHRARFRAASVVVPTHMVLGAGDTVVLKATGDGLRQLPERYEPPPAH